MPVLLPAGSGEQVDQSGPDHIVSSPEDRNRCCRLLRGANCQNLRWREKTST